MSDRITEERLEQAEPLIGCVARKFASRAVEVEDFEQELRIVALHALNSFDASKANWKTWIGKLLRWRAVDICRNYGYLSRQGKQVKVSPALFTDYEYSDSDGNSCQPFQLEPGDMSDHENESEWAELEGIAKCAGRDVLAAYWHVSGITMKEIGARLSIGESRVSQLISDGNGYMRLYRLISRDHEGIKIED